jgi:GTP 3',8-cyclase
MGYSLRVSVLENCQLRCNYCLPNAFDVVAKKFWLTKSDYKKIAVALRLFDIRKIRFTGGEPLLRPDLPTIIEEFSQVFFEIPKALTTNGLCFAALCTDLIRAGLNAVTFHLDTLKDHRYRGIMGRGQVKTVLDAIDLAKAHNLLVKLNVVVQKNINDDEIYDFLWWSKSTSIEVRFIELMNTGSAKDYVQKTFMSGAAILKKIQDRTRILPLARQNQHAPAETFFAPDLNIKFGLIASDTRPFCHSCDRLRLSADGHLRSCLYEPVGKRLNTDDEAALIREIKNVVGNKTSFHPSVRKSADFSMAQIGG